MRIALIIEQFDAARGGREASTAQVADELARRGHQVTVICQQAGVATQPNGQGQALELVQLGRGGWSRLAVLRNFVTDVERVLRERQNDFDVTHAMLPLPFVDVYQPRGGSVPNLVNAGIRRRGCGDRLAARLAAPLNRRRTLAARLERQLASRRDIWIAPGSRLVAQEFADHYGRSENVRVIFNAADVPPPELPQRPAWRQQLRAELGLADDATLFLSVAQNFALKGVPELLTAFAKWRAEPHSPDARTRAAARLLIVGGSRNRQRYIRRAQRLGLGQAVAFLPPTSEIFRCYAAADALLLLSWQDACSRVVLEATRWGIPSLTTRLNGAHEILLDGAGVVVDSPRDVAGILAGLSRLSDPAQRSAMGQACRSKFDFLGISRHVAELEHLYTEVIKKR